MKYKSIIICFIVSQVIGIILIFIPSISSGWINFECAFLSSTLIFLSTKNILEKSINKPQKNNKEIEEKPINKPKLKTFSYVLILFKSITKLLSYLVLITSTLLLIKFNIFNIVSFLIGLFVGNIFSIIAIFQLNKKAD